MFLLSPSALAAVLAHAERDAPLECCGFLAGRAGAATRAYPVPNELLSPTAFRTAPRGVFDAFRAMRARSEELLAVYHSHPSSAPVPSRRDLRENTYGPLPWLIVGRAAGAWEVAVWTLKEDDFVPVAWEVADCPESGRGFDESGSGDRRDEAGG